MSAMKLTCPAMPRLECELVKNCRSASMGTEHELLMRLLQGHISHLKPPLALQVAIHLLQRAQEVLLKPSLLPQHVSSAIQELASLQNSAGPKPTTPSLSLAGLTTPVRANAAEPQLEVQIAGKAKRESKYLSCEGSSIDLSQPLATTPGAMGMTRKPAALRMSVSTPTPSNGENEWGADNFSPSSDKHIGSTPAAEVHVPKPVHVGKRHSEPIPILLGTGADQWGTPSAQHGSKRRAKQGQSGSYILHLRASNPEPLLEADCNAEVDAHAHTASAATPTLRTLPAPRHTQPAPQPVPEPPVHVAHSGSSHGHSHSDNTSEDDEDVGKAVARALRHHLPGMPELSNAIAKLMLHEGMCSHQDLLRVAAGGRPSVLDAVAAAAVNNAMDCQMWLENMPSSSPSTLFEERQRAPPQSCNSAQRRFPARSKSAETAWAREEGFTLLSALPGVQGADH